MAKVKNTAKTVKKIKKDSKFKTKHYPCSYCNKTFSERAGRDHHMQLHSSERPYTCTLCPHSCKTSKYLAKHVRVVHTPPTSFKCEYCDKMFHFKSKLDEHMNTHTNTKPYKCKECGKGFNAQYSLKTHALIHKNLKPYKCQYCDYACRDSSTLRKHEERHRGVVTRYHCNLCDKGFSKKQTLQFHVAEEHMKVNLKKIPCDQCGRKFKTMKLLSIHIEVMHNRKFAATCEICGLRIANKYNMNSHLRSHVDVRPYKCAFSGCDKRYKDKSSLQKHTIIHYPDEQYPCKVCGRKFTRKARLRRHKIQHMARVKNVQCDYCGVCFYNKNYLAVHILKKHAKRKKKYICDMCDFESGNKPGLIRHIKGHSMRSDKECPICARKYKEDNWLRIHLWQAHQMMGSGGIPTLETNIKVEPLDTDGTPEFELFEIEKEEVLDELHSINENTNVKQNNATETITDKRDVINENNQHVLATDSDIPPNEDNSSVPESSETDLLGNNFVMIPDAQLSEYSTANLDNDDVLESSPNKISEEVSVHKNLVINSPASVDNLSNIDNETQIAESEELLDNVDDTKSELPNCVQIDNRINLEKDETNSQSLEDNDSTKASEEDDRLKTKINEQNSQPSPLKVKNKRTADDSYKIVRTIIPKNKSKRRTLAYIKTKIDAKKNLRIKKKIKRVGALNNKPPKEKTLAYIKAKILNRDQSENISTHSESLSESEEMEENLEYSRKVLSEDVTRCMAQKKKNPSEKNFDEFFVEHIERQERLSLKAFKIDKKSEKCVKNYVKKLLEKTRNENEVILIEKTRQQYNERITNARRKGPEKVSIKYFDKKVNNCIDNANQLDNEIDDIEAEESAIKYGDKLGDENICVTNNNLKDSDSADITANTDESTKKHKAESPSNKDTIKNGQKETNNERFNLRSDSNKKCSLHDKNLEDKNKNVEGCRKIKMNTHQCYVCFKLFPSKEILLDHCKDHFEVCNSTILKKCPLCDFATKLNIAQHMKSVHDVEITIPSTRILNKESENGPGYCYKVDSIAITDIDVIPSVKHLNKQAYVAIDRKNRKLKDIGIAKTKLVKKGNEWIVERQTTKIIDDVEKFLLPEFDVDEILSIKIDSNDYLSRMKKLYRLAKKYKRDMLFPCEHCEKICHTLSALKLHYRRHEPGSKPYKKKVWKHKMKDLVQPTKKKTKDITYRRKKNSPVEEIDKIVTEDKRINNNRYKKPKPIKNKHKCDPELIKFYETNIKGGDIEFWQFLKIFNKMSRENINDFEDLNERSDYGIHWDESKTVAAENTDDKKKKNSSEVNNKTKNSKKLKHAASENRFKRVIRISKKDYERRNEMKQRLREKIAKERLVEI